MHKYIDECGRYTISEDYCQEVGCDECEMYHIPPNEYEGENIVNLFRKVDRECKKAPEKSREIIAMYLKDLTSVVLQEVKSSKGEPMTRDEAYEAMKRGCKVAHVYFTDDEYLCMQGRWNNIVDEKGYDFNWGWKQRKGDFWEEGWYVREDG